jgi:hypothetical protein
MRRPRLSTVPAIAAMFSSPFWSFWWNYPPIPVPGKPQHSFLDPARRIPGAQSATPAAHSPFILVDVPRGHLPSALCLPPLQRIADSAITVVRSPVERGTGRIFRI